MMGTKYAVDEKESVNYSGSATAQDAKTLGEALKQWGYFDNSKTKDVLLHTDQAGTTISFVLGHGWDDEEILTAFKQVGPVLAEDLKANHITIRLIDDHLNTKKEIPIN
jgi:undecaprenyl pyrophosphate synthase